MAESSLDKRRQVYLLSPEDLKEHPVWEFCSDEEDVEDQDEATVRPVQVQGVEDDQPGAFVIAADVIFADGSKGEGYVYSGDPNDFGCTQPNVLVAGKQVGLWLGSLQYVGNIQQTVDQAYRLLGRSAESTFPMTFRSTVQKDDHFITSVVTSFMAIDESGSVKEIR